MICRATHNPRSIYEGLLIDLFAGGGGASLGIEAATGRAVDIAINHDPIAVGMHRINHPCTHHITQDVMDVDPRKLLGPEQWIAGLWLSPDCTHHSKAKGGRPIRDRKSRDLAWVGLKWAGLPKHQRPRVIWLENVEEWLDWGPLKGKRDPKTGRVVKMDGTVARPGEIVPLDDQMLVPRKRKKGRAFRIFVAKLRALGYAVEWRVLRACDYGTPTIRKRIFLIARCDGNPIIWPEATHGAKNERRSTSRNERSNTVCPTATSCQRLWESGRTGDFVLGRRVNYGDGSRLNQFCCQGSPRGAGAREKLKPFRPAAKCIDWSIECPSIFTRPRPLATNTRKRIAAGVVRHVIESNEPFIVSIANYGKANTPSHSASEPLGTVVGSQKHAVIAAWMVKHFGGVIGQGVDQPAPTQTCRSTQNQLAIAHLTNFYTSNTRGGEGDLQKPIKTITAGGNHHGLLSALIAPYYGSGSGETGRSIAQPMPTATTKDRLQLIHAALVKGDTFGLPAGFWRVWDFLTRYYGEDAPAPVVVIRGEVWLIVDLGMRMLQPRELYRAMGFPDSYIIDQYEDDGGRRHPLTKTAAVRMCGNSVAHDPVKAIVQANLPAYEGVAA